jgi:hypothetical protein
MKTATLLSLLLLAGAFPALAEPPTTRAGILLTLADSPAGLRSQLLTFADSAADAGDHLGAGEALGYAGTSFQREGRVDSAIVCHRRAFGLLDDQQSLLALVDQLLLRRAAGDASEAIRLLSAAQANSEIAYPPALVGRIAWARFLQGKPDTAAALFATVERWLLPRYEWRFRLARVALAGRNYRRAVELLMPNAVRSRGTDDEVIGMLEQAGKELGATPRIQAQVLRESEDRDKVEASLAAAVGGRLIELAASDAFPLGALLVPAAPARGARRAPPLLAVVLMAPGDTLASGDSLVVALHRHGLTTLLLHLRGYGASVGPSCPSPDAWFDREAALQARIARDVGDVVRGVRRVTPVDSTRYLVVGVGASATMAVEAAALDPRVKALLLVSPAPALVDRGPTRARLAQLRLPVFFQVSPDDFDESLAVTDLLYQAGDRSASRVVESGTGGQNLVQFRYDPALATRFLAWLDAALRPAKAPAAAAPPRRTPPPAPRRR